MQNKIKIKILKFIQKMFKINSLSFLILLFSFSIFLENFTANGIDIINVYEEILRNQLQKGHFRLEGPNNTIISNLERSDCIYKCSNGGFKLKFI